MTDQPNIVLLTADSVRSDYCGFHTAGQYDTTPFLSELSDDGVTFTDAVSPGPRTPSSVPTIFTGEPFVPSHRDAEDWSDRVERIAEHVARYPTIAERLKRRGYSTAAITVNPWTTANTNFDTGFDDFREIGRVEANFNHLPGSTTIPAYYLYQWWNRMGWFTQWPAFTDDIEAAFDGLEEPYFLWVFSLDSHNPYLIPRSVRTETNLVKMYYAVYQSNSVLTSDKSFIQTDLSDRTDRWLRQTYRDSIRSVDRLAEWLWEHVEHTDPLFVFHSDHGEAFGEHGAYGHQAKLYEEFVSVPFCIGNYSQSMEVNQQISLRRLPDVIESLALGQELSFEDPTGSDESVDSPESLFTETGGVEAIRDKSWKLIRTAGGVELYNLDDDPAERTNLADSDPDRTDRYQSLLRSARVTVRKKEQTTRSIRTLVRQ